MPSYVLLQDGQERARSGMSPAKLKYIMGHSDIDTTFNVYTHLGFEDVREDMLRCLNDKTAA